jgi:hypothetical protein
MMLAVTINMTLPEYDSLKEAISRFSEPVRYKDVLVTDMAATVTLYVSRPAVLFQLALTMDAVRRRR